LFYTQSRGNSVNLDFEAAIDRLLLGGAPASPAQEITADSATPYLGLYWLEQQEKAMVVVFDKDRLAVDIPSQGLITLKKASEPEAWNVVEAPDNSVKFHRLGDGRATAFDFRSSRTLTLKRLDPEPGLPGIDELSGRRPDADRAARIALLGHIRFTGTLETTAGNQKGSFDMLAEGHDRQNVLFKIGGGESRQIVDGRRAWAKYAASSPTQELPESMARTARLNGWLLSTGDWRKEFETLRVMKRVVLDGQPAFLVHAAPANGRQRLIYVGENGLTLGYDEVQELPGLGMVGCEVRFTDYRDVEGVQIPFGASVKFPTPMLGTLTYRVEKIETRVKPGKNPFAP